ncbi:AAA family ATPase [candidate division KSB1 bacterium]|nr:AAA family ATPase [candidate division KSB1 bacterium]
MLTRIQIRNFKRFVEVDLELGKTVVLIGPNNSGKTTALQALALWNIGVRRWNEKRKDRSSPEKRPGVTINRRDLIAIPVPGANLLWRNLHVRDVERIKNIEKITPKTQNVRIEIIVHGITEGKTWSCGLEFDYANEESFYCRPLRTNAQERMPIPPEVTDVKIAFLPPMSGLADREFIKQSGEIDVLIGQGQTAQVLRNLCFRIYQQNTKNNDWQAMVEQIHHLFGVQLQPPAYITERSEITMVYKNEQNITLDISSSGRGLQQTLLLLAHLYSNPGTVLLLDEPDAHLEIIRQRQTYNLLVNVAQQQNSQIIAASHSEVVLAEAAGRDTVIAFVGKPHRIDDRGSQLLKALRDIGFDQYYQAEQKGWVLYLENSTDFDILKTFARRLQHPAQACLEMPFVHYVETNLPQRARDHFFGLQEAKTDLVGIAIFDRLDKPLKSENGLTELMWRRNEIENYFCQAEVLMAYAGYDLPDDLFGAAERQHREQMMHAAIAEVTKLLEIDDLSPWSADVKASDQVLDRIFRLYFKKLSLPLLLRKSNYNLLANFLPIEKIDREIIEKLDAIVATASRAKPRVD